nr:hypothetical protein [Tanacetum cinerariifolium]
MLIRRLSPRLMELRAPECPSHYMMTLIQIAKEAALSLSSFCTRYRSSYETPSPSSSLTLPVRKRYRDTFELILDTDSERDEGREDDTEDDEEDKSSDANDEMESQDLDDDGQGLDDEGQDLKNEGPGMEEEEEEAEIKVQQQAVLVVDIAASEPLGLGYGRLGVVPLSQLKRYSSITHSFTSGYPSSHHQFLEVGAHLELHESILHDHTQCLDTLPPTLFKGYDNDLRELCTRSGEVRDEIFSHGYRCFRREQ